MYTNEELVVQMLHYFHCSLWSSPSKSSDDTNNLSGPDDDLSILTIDTQVSTHEVAQEVLQLIQQKTFLPWIPRLNITKSVKHLIRSFQDHHRNRIFIYNLCQIIFNHVNLPSSSHTPSSP